jgi:hypothetical protein
MSEEHDQVEVPENAIRDDPIAFGLTAPQLGLAGAAAAVAFVLNLLPIWLPLRLGLAILTAAPIFGVAVISIRGEPGYRWLLRFVRFARSERRWFVPSAATADSATAKSDPSDAPDLPERLAPLNTDQAAALSVPEDAPDTDPAALPGEGSTMSDKPVRLRLVAGDTAEQPDSDDRPPVPTLPDGPSLPHLLVASVSFASSRSPVASARRRSRSRPPRWSARSDDTWPATVPRPRSGSCSSTRLGSHPRPRSAWAYRPRPSRAPGHPTPGARPTPPAGSLWNSPRRRGPDTPAASPHVGFRRRSSRAATTSSGPSGRRRCSMPPTHPRSPWWSPIWVRRSTKAIAI